MILLSTLLLAAAREPSEPLPAPPAIAADQQQATMTGLRLSDIVIGSGNTVESGDHITCDYTLWLADGTLVDSSLPRDRPLKIPLGQGRVIKGFDEGLVGMREGGTRILYVPAALGYGGRSSELIPADSDLIFQVTVNSILEVRRPPEKPQQVENYETTPSGLRWAVLEEGTGRTPVKGDTVVVEYTGWTGATRFDSSYDKPHPLTIPIGVGRVIKGWDEALLTMKEGGKRQLVIPPELGYGRRGSPPLIPPGATLIFEVHLIEVR